MGADASANVIIGVIVKKDQLFKSTKTTRKCGNGHGIDNDFAAFCAYCGSKIETNTVETGADRLTVFAEEWMNGEAPDVAWDKLRDGIDDGNETLGVFDVRSTSSNLDRNDAVLALGYKILTGGGESPENRTESIDAEHLMKAFADVNAIAETLGLTNAEPQLFLNFHWSC